MKRIGMILGLLFFGLPVLAWAAEAVPKITGWPYIDQLITPASITMLMAAVVPLLIAFAKARLGLSRVSRFLPVVAAVLAIGIDVLQGMATNMPLGPQIAGVVGLGGVGLREVVDQVRKSIDG